MKREKARMYDVTVNYVVTVWADNDVEAEKMALNALNAEDPEMDDPVVVAELTGTRG